MSEVRRYKLSAKFTFADKTEVCSRSGPGPDFTGYRLSEAIDFADCVSAEWAQEFAEQMTHTLQNLMRKIAVGECERDE